MNEWWQAIITLAIGFVLGVVATLLFRKRVSDSIGERTEQLGQCVDEIGDSVGRADERVGESVSTSESVAESVERLKDGTDGLEDAIGEARGSVDRLRELIEAERERSQQT